MTGRLSIVRVRRLLISRFFAAFIVVLAITPFTAPFSSFGVAEFVGEKSLHGSSDSGKLADDLTDLAFLVVQALPTLAADYGSARATIARPDLRVIQTHVLRI